MFWLVLKATYCRPDAVVAIVAVVEVVV